MTWRELSALGLLKPDVEPMPHASLIELCDAGALVGGLAVAQDVRPDELLGPLLREMGGPAAAMKVLDVREGKAGIELVLERAGKEIRWRVKSLEELVRAANRAFAKDKDVRRVEILGVREARLQLWCVAKSR